MRKPIVCRDGRAAENQHFVLPQYFGQNIIVGAADGRNAVLQAWNFQSKCHLAGSDRVPGPQQNFIIPQLLYSNTATPGYAVLEIPNKYKEDAKL